jgi:hypothetical protein
MKTLKLIIMAVVFVCSSQPVLAQKPDNYKMLQQKRVEFLIVKLNLTVEESQKFWPLYNEYYEKKHELSIENRARFGDHEHLSQGTEEEYMKALNGLFDYKTKQEQLFQTYYRKYLLILSAEKVYQLYRYEEEFNKILLKQLKEPEPRRRD